MHVNFLLALVVMEKDSIDSEKESSINSLTQKNRTKSDSHISIGGIPIVGSCLGSPAIAFTLLLLLVVTVMWFIVLKPIWKDRKNKNHDKYSLRDCGLPFGMRQFLLNDLFRNCCILLITVFAYSVYNVLQ